MNLTTHYQALAISSDPSIRKMAMAQIHRLERATAQPYEESPLSEPTTSLVDLVRRSGVDLRPKGEDKLVGACPRHSSKSGTNLVVWTNEGRFWCSSCGWAGNAITWLAWREGINITEAKRRLGLPVGPSYVRPRPTLSREVPCEV